MKDFVPRREKVNTITSRSNDLQLTKEITTADTKEGSSQKSEVEDKIKAEEEKAEQQGFKDVMM